MQSLVPRGLKNVPPKALIFASEPSSGQVLFNELNPLVIFKCSSSQTQEIGEFRPARTSFPLRQSVYNAVLAGCLPRRIF